MSFRLLTAREKNHCETELLQRQKVDHNRLNSQKTIHIAASKVNYKMPTVTYMVNVDHVVIWQHCNLKL